MSKPMPTRRWLGIGEHEMDALNQIRPESDTLMASDHKQGRQIVYGHRGFHFFFHVRNRLQRLLGQGADAVELGIEERDCRAPNHAEHGCHEEDDSRCANCLRQHGVSLWRTHRGCDNSKAGRNETAATPMSMSMPIPTANTCFRCVSLLCGCATK